MFVSKINTMEKQNIKYRRKFSRQLMSLSIRLLQFNLFKGNNRFWINALRHQSRARRLRLENDKKGLQVPPVMIFSITNRCNLKCKGCYANAQERNIKAEMPSERIKGLFREASGLGTGIIMLAGGEPLLRDDVLDAAAAQKQTLFPLFTNGTMLQNGKMELFSKNRNLIPILSFEGDMLKTDSRRGRGTYDKVMKTASELKNRNMFYGMSVTINKYNFEEVMSPEFINDYYEQGCKLFFFVEYVPSCKKDIDNCLTEDQKKSFKSRLTNLRLVFSSLFIALPGDEEQYGGCLAAGRGFVHVSSTGDLEPCPFAPYSDINLSGISLEEGLKSEFLENIRSGHSMLKESQGGCTLWENREWAEEMLTKTSGKKASIAQNKEYSQITA